MKLVSFVIPCYCSEKTLAQVVSEIGDTMKVLSYKGNNYEHEIILVNDASSDGTYNVIKNLCKTNPKIKGISFSRNFGQHAALMAGLRNASGDYIVCLDDDGQTPANEADKLLKKLDEGYDAVYARYEHKHHTFLRNWGSKINEFMLRILLDKPSDLYVSSYFAIQRFIANDMIQYQNAYPYVIGLVLRTTKNITNVLVQHRNRREGKSGYNLSKLISLWLNGFTAFSIKPLRIATMLGGISAVSGFLYGIHIVIKKICSPKVPLGFSSIMSALVFFGGIIMIMLGLVGEYIGRIYISLNNSPQYVIKERINIE